MSDSLDDTIKVYDIEYGNELPILNIIHFDSEVGWHALYSFALTCHKETSYELSQKDRDEVFQN